MTTAERAISFIGHGKGAFYLPDLVEEGIPARNIGRFVKAGYARSSIIQVVGAPSTVERKIKQRSRLNVSESDRLARMARIIALAEDVFGDAAKARHWLQRPTHRLDGHPTPLSLLRTDAGTQQVEQWLEQIRYGVFA